MLLQRKIARNVCPSTEYHARYVPQRIMVINLTHVDISFRICVCFRCCLFAKRTSNPSGGCRSPHVYNIANTVRLPSTGARKLNFRTSSLKREKQTDRDHDNSYDKSVSTLRSLQVYHFISVFFRRRRPGRRTGRWIGISRAFVVCPTKFKYYSDSNVVMSLILFASLERAYRPCVLRVQERKYFTYVL